MKINSVISKSIFSLILIIYRLSKAGIKINRLQVSLIEKLKPSMMLRINFLEKVWANLKMLNGKLIYYYLSLNSILKKNFLLTSNLRVEDYQHFVLNAFKKQINNKSQRS
jgi:hypothetical protein